MQIGYSFAPGSQSVPVSGSNRSIGGPQSAVEVRSLTLPNRFVPGQIAPQQLLQSPGGGGQPQMAVLRQLMEMFAPQGQQPGVPMLAPTPSSPVGGQPRNHTQPVRMDGAPPFTFDGFTNTGGAVQQDVPLTHSPLAPPRLIPASEPERPGPISPPEPPPSRAEPQPFDLNPGGFGAGGNIKNPLFRAKFEGMDIPGLFD